MSGSGKGKGGKNKESKKEKLILIVKLGFLLSSSFPFHLSSGHSFLFTVHPKYVLVNFLHTHN
jgi:hypothetical protein